MKSIPFSLNVTDTPTMKSLLPLVASTHTHPLKEKN